jgi:cell shape-determining protein MreC
LHVNQITVIFSDSSNTKFILDRINQAETYLGSICVQFGKVCRKEAQVRDCNDELVQNMFEFADRQRINTSLRQSLQQYASYLSAVEDYRNTLVSFNL